MKELFLVELQDVEHRKISSFAETMRTWMDGVPCWKVERPDDDTVIIGGKKFVCDNTPTKVCKFCRYADEFSLPGAPDSRWKAKCKMFGTEDRAWTVGPYEHCSWWSMKDIQGGEMVI